MNEQLFCDTYIQVNCETCSEEDEEPHHMKCVGVGLFQCENCSGKILIDLEKNEDVEEDEGKEEEHKPQGIRDVMKMKGGSRRSMH